MNQLPVLCGGWGSASVGWGTTDKYMRDQGTSVRDTGPYTPEGNMFDLDAQGELKTAKVMFSWVRCKLFIGRYIPESCDAVEEKEEMMKF